MSKLQFNPEDLDAIKDKISSIGYTQYTTFEDSGGKILRYYLNVVYNISTGEMIPYVTVGLGMTKFTAGPSIIGDNPSLSERFDIYYEDASAVTLFLILGRKLNLF